MYIADRSRYGANTRERTRFCFGLQCCRVWEIIFLVCEKIAREMIPGYLNDLHLPCVFGTNSKQYLVPDYYIQMQDYQKYSILRILTSLETTPYPLKCGMKLLRNFYDYRYCILLLQKVELLELTLHTRIVCHSLLIEERTKYQVLLILQFSHQQ